MQPAHARLRKSGHVLTLLQLLRVWLFVQQPFGAQSSMAPRLWTRPSGIRMLDDSPVQPVSCGMLVEGTACLSAHVRPESYEVQPSE